MSTVVEAQRSASTKPKSAWRAGLIATLVATVINALLFLVGSLFTFPADAITPMGSPITIVPVIIITVLGGVVATVGYMILRRSTPSKWTNRIMWVGAVVVLIGMFFSPFGIENVSAAQIVILEIMHVVAGIFPVAALTRQ